ncbi:MAG: carbohydrate ABC transporter permease [Clostridiaceae bacterium]|nr:carbohydrate ABC transporter permease [Clostridiaceae bacterium]
MSLIKSVRKKTLLEQCILIVCSCILLLLAFVPIFLMLTLSLKSNVQIYGNFWSLPSPIHWENYHIAIDMLIPNMINTTLLVPIATFFTLLLSSMSGYVFARLEFPGKNFLFMAVLSLMMIPGVLTLTPSYKLMQDLNLYNTWWALLLPWVSGGQVFGILLCRTFISSHPAALFEAARIDGATEFKSYYMIAIPLSKPILATLTIMSMMNYYNDFIWPLMVIDSNYKQMITVAIRVFQSATGAVDIGSMVAGFVFATIPLLILFLFGSRLYIEGVTSGAIKT